MKKYNQCGVYVIRNIENGKMYIGSTSNSFRKRWETHRKRLKKTNIIVLTCSLPIINMEKTALNFKLLK